MTVTYLEFDMLTQTPTIHERLEWSRMAQAAYNIYRSDIGHRMSIAASRSSMPLAEFDARAKEYRAWLVFNEFAPKV